MRRTNATLLALVGAVACARHESTRDTPAIAASVPAATAAATTSAPAIAPAAVPAAASASASAPARPMLHARARVLVHAEPSLRGKWIGYVAPGGAVALRDEPARAVPGCDRVRAIEPHGWACADGDKATLDPDDPVVVALRAHAPEWSSPWPYAYGESRGARRHKTLAEVAAPAWPASLRDAHDSIAPRSTVAWTGEVRSDGAAWLWTSDASFVRKDRVAPFARSDFHGVHLDAETRLPIAFFKRGPHAKMRPDDRGRFAATHESWPRLAWVALTGRTEKRGARTFWETREAGAWLDARDAAIVAPDRDESAKDRRTWIEVAALQGWLVAYEGETPVFATMISAGKLGTARPDPDHEPHVPAATTPVGTFRIKEKFVTTTLQSDLDDGTEFVHAEVPWSQHFYDKYLLHTAYWHDAWGEGRSGGCVNLSPTDAKWLFEWSEPRVPEGWHAVRASGDDATAVVVHP